MLQAYNYETGAQMAASSGGMAELLGQLGKYTSSDLVTTSTYVKGANAAVAGKLETLQSQLNRISAPAAITPLVVDGKIGKNTYNAIQQALRWTRSQSAAAKAVAGLQQGVPAYTAIATYAAELAGEFKRAGDASFMPPATAPQVAMAHQGHRNAGAGTSTHPDNGGGTTPAVAHKKSNVIWWIVGALALAGVGTVGYMTYKRKSSMGSGRAAYAS